MRNPKNVNAITLRSGKQIDVLIPTPAPAPAPVPVLVLVLVPVPVPIPILEREEEDNLVKTKRNMPLRKQQDEHVVGNSRSSSSAPSTSGDLQQPTIPLPFSPRITLSKKDGRGG